MHQFLSPFCQYRQISATPGSKLTDVPLQVCIFQDVRLLYQCLPQRSLHTSHKLLAQNQISLYAKFLPRGKVPEKVHIPVLQVWPDDVTLGYFQGTHFSPSQQDCSTPSLSRWVSGHVPAFPTHTFHGLFM